MRRLAVPVEHHKTGWLSLHVLPCNRAALGKCQRALQVARECIERRRELPLDQSAGGHRGQMAPPRRIGQAAHFKIRHIGGPGQDMECDLPFANVALQVVHDECRRHHVLYVELGLRTANFQTQVEPHILRDIDCARKARPAVDLPVRTSAQDRGVLHGVGLPRLVLAQRDPRAIVTGGIEPKLNAEKATQGGRADVHVDYAVTDFKVLQYRCSTIEVERPAPLVIHRLDLRLKVPARGIGRDAQSCSGCRLAARLRRLGKRCRGDQGGDPERCLRNGKLHCGVPMKWRLGRYRLWWF